MANEIEKSLKGASAKIVDYINNAATLTVETRYLDLEEGIAEFAQAKPVMQTTIRLVFHGGNPSLALSIDLAAKYSGSWAIHRSANYGRTYAQLH